MQSSAPLWRRLAALLYDSLIITAIALAYSALITFAAVSVFGNRADNYQPMFSGPLPSIGLILSLSLYYCWFWRKSGQTIGMRSWSIRLVDEHDHSRSPQWRQCVSRCMAGIPAFWLLGIGYWYRLIDAEGACLHDRLSGTRVVTIPKRANKQVAGTQG